MRDSAHALFRVAAALVLSITAGGVALATSPGSAKLSPSDCVSAWNATPRALAITALQGSQLARIQVFNLQKYTSGCIVSILRPGPKGIVVVGSPKGAEPITWRAPGAARMTRDNVRVNAVVSPGGVLALR